MPKPRVVIVSNADVGIGRATAIWLAETGFRVLACGDPALMGDLPRETGPGGVIVLHGCSVESRADCDAAVAHAHEVLGSLNGVVATQDMRSFGPVEGLVEETQSALMEVNFYRPLRLFKAAIPCLRAQGQGRLVCVTSAAGRLALPMSGAYSASQYAIEGMCDALRLELSLFGVSVVVIEPTFVREAVAERAQPLDMENHFGLNEESPYRRLLPALQAGVDRQMSRASTPHAVAVVVHRAMTSPKPRPRYAVTRRGAALLWARKILPDRVLDRRIAKRTGLLATPEDVRDD